MDTGGTHVAIFRVHRIRRVLGIFAMGDDQAHAWNGELELTELLKEWSTKIERPTVLECIPVISPPRSLIVDCVRFVWMMDRNDGLPCQIAGSRIEVAFVPMGEASLKATLRTHGRCWHLVGMPIQFHRHTSIERAIVLLNLKWL